MRPGSVKRATLTLFAISYYMLFTILLVILQPGGWVKALLIIIFGIISYGLECFFCIGSNGKRAVFSESDFGLFGSLLPSLIYLAAGLIGLLDLRSELLFTALAAFLGLMIHGFMDGFTGLDKKKHKDDRNDNDKGE